MRTSRRLDELLDRLPTSLAALLRAELSPALLEAATVGHALAAPGAVSPILTGALVGEGVATLLDQRGRHDIPLATLLVGAVPPHGSEVESIRFAVGGGYGVARGETVGGPVVAVARRDPNGRVLVAMSGVAPAPVLVREPADLNRSGWGPLDRELVVRLHRQAIDAISDTEPDTEPLAALAEARDTEPTAVPAPAPAPVRPAGRDSVVIVAAEPGPPMAVVGTRRALSGGPTPAGPGGRVARSWVVPILGPPSATVESTSVGAHGPDVLDVVLLDQPDRTTDPTILGGVVAISPEAGARAVAGIVLDVGPPTEPVATVEIQTLLGETDDASHEDREVGPDDTETLLRIDDPVVPSGESPDVTADLDEAGRLVVRTAVTDPFELRRGLALRLGLGAARIRVVALAGQVAPTSAMDELVARAALQTGRAVIGTVPVLSRSGARAVTVRSTVDADGSVGFLQATTLSVGETTSDQRTEAGAWATELHLAAVARAAARPREELIRSDPSATDGLDAVIEHGKVAIDFGRRNDPSWREPADRPHIRRGLGYAVAAVEAAPPAAVSATASFAGASSFLVAVTTGDTTAGLHVALARVAAEVLGVAAEQITVLGGDTDRVPPGDMGLGAGFAVSAAAVKQAADELRARLQERAALRLGVATRTIELVDGAAVAADGRSIELEDLAEPGGGAPAEPLVGTGIGRVTPGVRGEGAVFAAVEVDTSTGRVTVLELVTAVAAGIVVDPDGAALHQRDRALAAAADALGRSVADDGVAHTAVFLTSVADGGPFGARSLGSVPNRATAPALHAALVDAIGVELEVLPLTPERVAGAIAAFEGVGR